MRISIEIDINESEIDLATELLSSLRSLTDQIRVKQVGGKEVIPNGIHSSADTGSQTPPSPAAQPAAAPAPPVTAAPQHSADIAGVDPDHRNNLSMFIRSSTTERSPDLVVTSIQQVLENKPDNDKLFISAYLDVLLDKAYEQPDDNQKQEHAVYLSLVNGLSSEVKSRIAIPLTQQVIKIMGGRTRNNRLEQLLPALVFTTFLQMGLTNVKGMLRMVGGFLKSPNMVTVGLTMLGKSFEMCCAMVLSQASPASLETLKEQLDKLGPQYNYDIDYLNNFLRFNEPSFRVLATRSKVHSGPITAMGADATTNQLISASRTGEIFIWDEYAKLLQRHKLQQQWGLSIIVDSDQREALIATRGITPRDPCSVVTIGLDNPWDIKATRTLSQATGISCITMLPDSRVFAVGEQRKTSEGTSNVIAAYPASGGDAAPICTMTSQSGLVTCISAFQTSSQVLLAGSQGDASGGLVQLWAIQRPEQPVKSFALPPNAGFPTCLEQEASSTTILAGTSQKVVVQWDISAIGRTGPDESVQPIRTFVLDGYPVAKLQFWQNPRVTGQVAILTAHGCWHVDLAKEGDQAGKPFVQHVQDVPGDDITYQALTWAGTLPYLYVGGQSQSIHVVQLVQ